MTNTDDFGGTVERPVAVVTAEEVLRRTIDWERARRSETDAPRPDYDAEDAALRRAS